MQNWRSKFVMLAQFKVEYNKHKPPWSSTEGNYKTWTECMNQLSEGSEK